MRCCLFLLLVVLLILPLYGDNNSGESSSNIPPGTDFSQLNKGDPEKSYRIKRVFSAYKPLGDMWNVLKVGHYSAFENPTGIYFEQGSELCVTLHNAPAASGSAELIIHNFAQGGGHSTYPLRKGRNHITAKNRGLGYIDYRSSEGSKATPITVSIEGGIINGVFSRHDTPATWRRLYTHTAAGIMDMVGERCQIAFSVTELRRGAGDKGGELLALYDQIVELQQKLMGWDQQGIHPGNHVLCRVMWKGYMQADGMGAAFHHNTLAGICDPEGLRRGSWGVAHELGHVNQIHPGFCWAGMAEVTNNLFAQWCSHQLCPEDVRLEHEVASTADGQTMRGGRFDCYVNNAIVRRQLWQFQAGPDSDVRKVPGKLPGDPFVTLCPLWQLLLYCQVAREVDDFYPEIFRKIRASNDDRLTNGQARANFCRFACDAARLDLSDFLLRTGMVGLINRPVEDYRTARVTVTEEMVDAVLRNAANYPQPDSSVIYYINANNVEIYRKRLNIVPSPDFRPLLPSQDGDYSELVGEEANRRRAKGEEEPFNIVIPADKWKNAVAFEVYRGEKLIRVCLRGLGQQDNESTTIICPPRATAIRAVQWDGERITVAETDVPEKNSKKNRPRH